jgi:phosphoglycolate phosphatase
MTNIALFDLDGTLTDPAVGIVRSFHHGMEAVGIDPAAHEPLERFIGPPLQESFAGMGLDSRGVAAAIEGYREYYAVTGIFENVVYDGVPELLTQLKTDGWVLGVATSKPEPFANRILDHFGLADFFTVTAGATMDGSRRHKQDVIKHALGQLNWVPHETGKTVMIGDRDVDIAGGHALGLSTIGAVWGYGSVEELIEERPSALASKPSEILQGLPLC